MILREVRSSTDWSFIIDLHPNITIVGAMEPELLERMAEMIASAIRGQSRDVSAVITLEGESVEITPQLAQELGLDDGDVDLVLRESDLPGAFARDEFAANDFAEVPPTDTVEEELDDAGLRAQARDEIPIPEFVEPEPVEPEPLPPPPIEPELTESPKTPIDPSLRVRYELDDVMQEDIEGFARTAWMAMERAFQEREHARSLREEAQMSSINKQPPPIEDARRAVADVTHRLEELTATVAEVAGAKEAVKRAHERLQEATRRRDSLRELRDELEKSIGEEPTIDLAPVETAYENLRRAIIAAEEVASQIDPRANELLQQWTQVQNELNRSAPSGSPVWLIEQTQSTLDAARDKVEHTEIELKMASADHDDIQAVEAAHVDVVAAQVSAHKRFSGGKARTNLDAALAAEQLALGKIGVPSYESFRLQLGSFGRQRSTVEELLIRARKELADAELMWDELRNASKDPILDELFIRRDRILADATRLAKQPVIESNIESALSSIHVDPPDNSAYEEALQIALQNAGVPRAEAPVEIVADEWLRRQHELNDQNRTRAQLSATISDLENTEAGIAVLEEELQHRRAVSASQVNPVEMESLIEEAKITRKKAEAELQTREEDWQNFSHTSAEIYDLAESEGAAHRVYVQSREILLGTIAAQRARASQPQQREPDLSQAETLEKAREVHAYQVEVANHARARRFEELRAERDARVAARPVVPEPVVAQKVVSRHIDVSSVNDEDMEVYTLSRLSALRLVGSAGAVPLIVDDTFHAFDEYVLGNILGLLQRVSRVIQVVFLTNDERVFEWAVQMGPDNAAVRRFTRATS